MDDSTPIILVVDGDAKHATQLAGDLALESGWTVLAARSAAEGLALLAKEPVSVVVSDLRLPGGGDTLFLNEVMKRRPRCHRIILSDLKDRPSLLKHIGTAHQFIAKPCGVSRLKAALDRVFQYDLWLPGEGVRDLMAQLVKLPSPPQLFFRIVRELQNPDASVDSVAALIARDPAIAAKLLQIVNSAAFGLGQPVSDLHEAVLHIGVEMTKSVVLLAHCFAYFDGLKAADFSPQQLWQHSLRVAQIARLIAREEKAAPELMEAAYTAGLLHDLGKIALAANLPKHLSTAGEIRRATGCSAEEAENQVFGATHAEVGACLLAIWGLSPEIIEALVFHHHPVKLRQAGFCPLTAVHAANALEHALADNSEPGWDTQYLTDLGLAGRAAVWREVARERLGEPAAAAVAA